MSFSGSNNPATTTSFEVSDYITISDPHEGDQLGIGRIVGTNNLFLERFTYVSGKSELYNNMGLLKKKQIEAIIMDQGWIDLSSDESIPLETRYMDLIKKKYKGFVTIRRKLHPIVKGFIEPLSVKDGGYGYDQSEYREEYYKKRLGDRYYLHEFGEEYY